MDPGDDDSSSSDNGPLTAAGKRPVKRLPRYESAPRLRRILIKPPQRRKSKKLTTTDERELKRRRRETCLDALAKLRSPELDLVWPCAPLEDAADIEILEKVLKVEDDVMKMNRQLEKREAGTSAASQGSQRTGDGPAPAPGPAPSPRFSREFRQETVEHCCWGRTCLTPRELGNLYRLPPSFLTDFASWDLSLFQAVDMPVPVDLILDSLLQDLCLVPLRPGSLWARTADLPSTIPHLESPARDMHRVVAEVAQRRPPLSDKDHKDWRSYHMHVHGKDRESMFAAWYVPCNHPGKCTPKSCTCIRGFNYCTPLCCNGLLSTNAYAGCHCTSGCTAASSCQCVRAGRECDPSVCACTGCANNALQKGTRTKLRIGPSTVPEWGRGAFVCHPVAAGRMIDEYVGELISEAECSRRFPVHRNGHNYMFSVTSDVVIDASRVGNDTRYINHDPVAPNCEPRAWFVRTRWRLALHAARDIAEGEELFFDYGPTFALRSGIASPSPPPGLAFPSPGLPAPLPGSTIDARGPADEEDEEGTDDGEVSSAHTEDNVGMAEVAVGDVVAVFAEPADFWLGQVLRTRAKQLLLLWLDRPEGADGWRFISKSDWVWDNTVLMVNVRMRSLGEGLGWDLDPKDSEWLQQACARLLARRPGRGPAAASPPPDPLAADGA